ncbi:hypothetical protein B9479_008083 [Cryptococcus floricola]|uniref:Uncharacterized protein n=1 Tax=Cryptococcus floricola TaxID=2591691 RepID=A0A5D3AIE7_9TREE|nr:hypothetical protein B9479_008083 [Cryptococcus floricola]
MRRKLLFGLPAAIFNRVEDRLDDRGLGRSSISLPLLRDLIERMFRTELPAPPFSAYFSAARQPRPSPAVTPRPSALPTTTTSDTVTHLTLAVFLFDDILAIRNRTSRMAVPLIVRSVQASCLTDRHHSFSMISSRFEIEHPVSVEEWYLPLSPVATSPPSRQKRADVSGPTDYLPPSPVSLNATPPPSPSSFSTISSRFKTVYPVSVEKWCLSVKQKASTGRTFNDTAIHPNPIIYTDAEKVLPREYWTHGEWIDHFSGLGVTFVLATPTEFVAALRTAKVKTLRIQSIGLKSDITPGLEFAQPDYPQGESPNNFDIGRNFYHPNSLILVAPAKSGVPGVKKFPMFTPRGSGFGTVLFDREVRGRRIKVKCYSLWSHGVKASVPPFSKKFPSTIRRLQSVVRTLTNMLQEIKSIPPWRG